MAFSEKLRDVVTKSHKIGSGLWGDFISSPVKEFLHWKSVKDRMPSLVVSEHSRMRKRFDHYLGYEQHRVKYDEDFWKRRQDDKNSVLEVEWKKYKISHPRAGDILSEKPRVNGDVGLAV